MDRDITVTRDGEYSYIDIDGSDLHVDYNHDEGVLHIEVHDVTDNIEIYENHSEPDEVPDSIDIQDPANSNE